MSELQASFDAAVETLPGAKGRTVDMFRSTREQSGTWELRDSRGVMVAKVRDPAFIDPEEEEKKQRAPMMATKAYVDSLVQAATKAMCKSVIPEIDDIRKCIDLLANHVKGLEGDPVDKSLDAAAYDAMTELAERLEQMEAKVAESEEFGFRYRGYWRDGMKIKRGDAYTHDGSLWYALRSTEDKPCRESNDWNVVARKGRDAQ